MLWYVLVGSTVMTWLVELPPVVKAVSLCGTSNWL
jgi:hypothetical protein